VTGDLDDPYPLDPRDIRAYRDRGHVTLGGVLRRETIDHYRPEIARLVAERTANRAPLAQRSVYDRAFLQVMNLWTASETVKRFVMSRRLGRLAAELMGVAGVRMYHDQALFKEAGGGFTPWHADQFYWPLASDGCTTAWIPLQDTPREMGPVAFADGSFRLQEGRDLEIGEESERRLQRSLRDFPTTEAPFAAGDVSFHSGWTFHRAGPNATDRPREVMTIIYMDRDMRLAAPKHRNQELDREVWCPGVAVGAVIDSPINPVIYDATA